MPNIINDIQGSFPFFPHLLGFLMKVLFSLLARIEYIGSVDKSTGKVELRFYIDEIDKTVFYFTKRKISFNRFLF